MLCDDLERWDGVWEGGLNGKGYRQYQWVVAVLDSLSQVHLLEKMTVKSSPKEGEGAS